MGLALGTTGYEDAGFQLLSSPPGQVQRGGSCRRIVLLPAKGLSGVSCPPGCRLGFSTRWPSLHWDDEDPSAEGTELEESGGNQDMWGAGRGGGNGVPGRGTCV